MIDCESMASASNSNILLSLQLAGGRASEEDAGCLHDRSVK